MIKIGDYEIVLAKNIFPENKLWNGRPTYFGVCPRMCMPKDYIRWYKNTLHIICVYTHTCRFTCACERAYVCV